MMQSHYIKEKMSILHQFTELKASGGYSFCIFVVVDSLRLFMMQSHYIKEKMSILHQFTELKASGGYLILG